jgi:hypothetical protein
MSQKGRKKQTTNQHQGNNQQPNVPPQPHGQANPGMIHYKNVEFVCVSRWEVFSTETPC